MRISVYITSYNQKDYLVEAIESALSQTLKPFQIILVDDCSIDSSRQVIEGYRSRFPELVTPIYHERNTGVAKVRIDALNAVKGDYVTYMDGDDRFLPTKLEKEAKALKESNGAAIAFSNNYYMTEGGGEHTGVWAEEIMPPEGDVFVQTFARDFPRNNLFRMELVDYGAWKGIGFHDPCLSIYEDYDMRIRLTRKLKTVYYDEPLSEIRVHNKGLSKSDFSMHLEAIQYIFEKNRPLLDDLSPGDRAHVEKGLIRVLSRLAFGTAGRSFQRREYAKTLKFLYKSFLYRIGRN